PDRGGRGGAADHVRALADRGGGRGRRAGRGRRPRPFPGLRAACGPERWAPRGDDSGAAHAGRRGRGGLPAGPATGVDAARGAVPPGMPAWLAAAPPLPASAPAPPRLTAVRLPGYRPTRVTSFEPRGVSIATLVLIALLGFAAVTDRTAWPVVAAAGVVAAAA